MKPEAAGDLPLVAPSYNHTPDERAAMGCLGALAIAAAALLFVLAATGAL